MRVDMNSVNRHYRLTDESEALLVEKSRSVALTDQDQNDQSFQQWEPYKKEVEKSVEKINQLIEPHKTSLHFVLHDKLNKYYVQVIDTKTKEVVREIPPKKFLDMYAHTVEMLGFIIDKKA